MPFCIYLLEFQALLIDHSILNNEKHTRIAAPELMNKGSKAKQDENMQAPSIILEFTPIDRIKGICN